MGSKMIEIDQERPPYSPWIEETCKKIRQGDAEQFVIATGFASHIYTMGEEAEGDRLFQLIYDACKTNGQQLDQLLQLEVDAGARQSVLSQIAQRVRDGAQIEELRSNISSSYDPYITEAFVRQWWEPVKAQKSNESDIEVLERVWALVAPETPGENTAEVRALLEVAHKSLQEQKPRDRPNYLQHLYLTALVNDIPDLAIRYLEEKVMLAFDRNSRYGLARLLAREERWAEAAIHFETLWQTTLEEMKRVEAGDMLLDTTSALQAGLAYRKAGETEKGDQLIQLARLLVLGDLSMRNRLGSFLAADDENELAREEWLLAARCSRLEETAGKDAFLTLANEFAKTDPGRAANYQECTGIMLHRQSMNLRGALLTRYVRLRSQVHQWRTVAALKESKIPEALKTLEAYWKLTPGNASIGEELLPALEAAGDLENAEAYYEKTRAYALEACRLYPNSAMAHNNLAWLDARTRHRLDEAMEHANTAVKLKPKTAAYIDTLAEVHFTLGDREKALKYSREAVALTPDDEELQGQLRRFESAPIPAKRAGPPSP